MAYPAVISLYHTIDRLLNSSRISIASPSQEALESAFAGAELVEDVLGMLHEMTGHGDERERKMEALEGQIRETVSKLEDVIESHVVNLSLSHFDSLGDSSFVLPLDLQELRQDIDGFSQRGKKMELLLKGLQEELMNIEAADVNDDDDSDHRQEMIERFVISSVDKAASIFGYTKETDNPLPEEEEEDDDDDVTAVGTDFLTDKSEMVGLSTEFHDFRDWLLQDHIFKTYAITGMAGIGKTALAMKIFEDELILKKFKWRAFVRVGQKYDFEEILQAILAQVDPESDKMPLKEDEELCLYLSKFLSSRRYLIVLDDVWDGKIWWDLENILQPKYGTQMLVTTRREEVVQHIGIYCTYKLRFLNNKESWDLLRKRVFGEEFCSFQLEKAGRKIADNCEGLPLLILKVAALLSRADRTPECWNKVAASKKHSIFMAAYDQMLDVLYPSFYHLPRHLRTCFLYMGAFPQDSGVRHFKLVNLWKAEGFLKPDYSQKVSKFAKELVSNNVVQDRRWSESERRVKAYGLHSVFWHLCKREAANNKFLHILECYSDSCVERMKDHRRLAIYNNVLFGIKDVYASIVSISTARSLLCTGLYHQYQVPICFSLNLLRVFDALTTRFYKFPMEVLKLMQLRYLSLTCNENLPPSISKLWNLQYLIIHQPISIKLTGAESFLPAEIWDLRELKYLQICGRNLPDSGGSELLNLGTLLDVGVQSCTEGVFLSIPNLKKLRVRIELAPDDGAETLSYCDNMFYLFRLKSLRCEIANPIFRPEIITPPPLPNFSISLRKLTLCGFGYPWEYMTNIARLLFLEVLKLQCHAFRGEQWEVEDEVFLSLRYLVMEDIDLVDWIVGKGTFPQLEYVTLKNCYRLREIPHIHSLSPVIQLVDCNPLMVTHTKNGCRVHADCSWNEGNHV